MMIKYDSVSYAVDRFHEPVTEYALVSDDRNRDYT